MEENRYETNDVIELSYKNKKAKYILIVIGIIYLAFFTSKLYILTPLSSASEIGKANNYMDSRSVTLVSAIYDEEKEVMEIVLTYENKSLDNVDDYYYTATPMEKSLFKNHHINVAYHKPLFTVLRVENLTSGYRQLDLYLAPKIVKEKDIKDKITGTITLNKNNVKLGNVDLDKSEKDYLDDRFSALIKEQKSEIKNQKKTINKLENEINAIDKTEKDYENNKEYMSSEERERQEYRISQNKEAKISIQDRLLTERENLIRMNEELSSLEDRKNQL